MTVIREMTLEQIQTAADKLKQRQSDLTALLTFYENIFQAQEAEIRQVDLSSVHLDELALVPGRSNPEPLAAPSEFKLDVSSCKRMLAVVCRLIENSENTMAESAKAIKSIVDQDAQVEALCGRLLKGDDAYFNGLATQQQADKAAIAFIVYHSIRPSLLVYADQLAGYVDTQQEINGRQCAICGHLPGLAILDKDGKRELSCSFCEHRWAVRRVFCPYCGETDANQLQYFYSELESEYRIDVCEQCRHYLKTIDTRKTDRPIYLPLEQVASLHLDLNAQEKGYQSAVALALDGA